MYTVNHRKLQINARNTNKKSDIAAGFLILQTHPKSLLSFILQTFCCLQSVKDTKFESNSQLLGGYDFLQEGCLQSVKDTKFESNSQPMQIALELMKSCLQSVKDTKFESNSQRTTPTEYFYNAVCSPSKIQSLKAIHNKKAVNPAESEP